MILINRFILKILNVDNETRKSAFYYTANSNTSNNDNNKNSKSSNRLPLTKFTSNTKNYCNTSNPSSESSTHNIVTNYPTVVTRASTSLPLQPPPPPPSSLSSLLPSTTSTQETGTLVITPPSNLQSVINVKDLKKSRESDSNTNIAKKHKGLSFYQSSSELMSSTQLIMGETYQPIERLDCPSNQSTLEYKNGNIVDLDPESIDNLEKGELDQYLPYHYSGSNGNNLYNYINNENEAARYSTSPLTPTLATLCSNKSNNMEQSTAPTEPSASSPVDVIYNWSNHYISSLQQQEANQDDLQSDQLNRYPNDESSAKSDSNNNAKNVNNNPKFAKGPLSSPSTKSYYINGSINPSTCNSQSLSQIIGAGLRSGSDYSLPVDINSYSSSVKSNQDGDLNYTYLEANYSNNHNDNNSDHENGNENNHNSKGATVTSNYYHNYESNIFWSYQ